MVTIKSINLCSLNILFVIASNNIASDIAITLYLSKVKGMMFSI